MAKTRQQWLDSLKCPYCKRLFIQGGIDDVIYYDCIYCKKRFYKDDLQKEHKKIPLNSFDVYYYLYTYILTYLKMKLKCNNQACGYEWDYNGKAKFYATCPRCLYKVRINKKKKGDKKNDDDKP